MLLVLYLIHSSFAYLYAAEFSTGNISQNEFLSKHLQVLTLTEYVSIRTHEKSIIQKFKSQVLKAFLYLRGTHEEVPQQSAAVVLNHRGNGQLVDGQVPLRIPIVLDAECIVKSVFSPDTVAQFNIEMF